ncbi:hypothetical protein, partial [Oenococcus oeni]
HEQSLKNAKKLGYIRARIDGKIVELDNLDDLKLDRETKHTIEIMIDRIILKDGIRSRLFDAMEAATRIADGQVVVEQ